MGFMITGIWKALLMASLVACTQNTIPHDDATNDPAPPFTVSTAYVSVDYAQFTLNYTDFDAVSWVEVRRDTSAFPATTYDGDLVFLDTTFKNELYDYNPITGTATLSPHQSYYYSVFYAPTAQAKPIKLTDISIKTLSYKAGMHQTLQELMAAARAAQPNLQFMIASNRADVLLDTDAMETVFTTHPVITSLSGVVLTPLQFDYANGYTTRDTPGITPQERALFPTDMPLFGLDYADANNATTITAAQAYASDNNIIELVRPHSLSGLSAMTLPSDTTTDAISHVADAKNFIFMDRADEVTTYLDALKSSDYDLIIMTPFSADSSWESPRSAEDVDALRTKSTGNSRLVFAYIDISRVFSTDTTYWQSEWNNIQSQPQWINKNITPNSPDYYANYWRHEWKTILKTMITTIATKGYNGIVWGNTHVYAQFPIN